jgi:hypothetical protein
MQAAVVAVATQLLQEAVVQEAGVQVLIFHQQQQRQQVQLTEAAEAAVAVLVVATVALVDQELQF